VINVRLEESRGRHMAKETGHICPLGTGKMPSHNGRTCWSRGQEQTTFGAMREGVRKENLHQRKENECSKKKPGERV